MRINSIAQGVFASLGLLLQMAVANADGTRIEIDANASLGPVNRHAFGHNMEAADGRGLFGEPAGAKKYSVSGIMHGQGLWNPAERKSWPAPVKLTRETGIGMMRYPGGCLAHNYDWRMAVGPLAERGNWQFGIDEYITLCRDLGAEPLFTISDYVLPAAEMPAHAADLVEYLNSPATPDHPWAMKRKAWGHPEPFGVKWFELGNESDHGNHSCVPGRRFTPEEYVSYAVACAAAMRKVDPTIKIGVVTKPGNGYDYDCPWNMAVYKGACPIADFLVVHFYGPGVSGTDFADNFKSCMAYADQLQRYMKSYRKLCEEGCGRDLPLAVTEYNIGNSGNADLRYRFSYMAGMLCADFIRLWLLPSNNVVNADYWQVVNGWWGMFNASKGEISDRRATLPFFQLLGAHFGTQLLKTDVVNGPRFEAPAAGGLMIAKGDGFVESVKAADVPLAAPELKYVNLKGLETTSSSPDNYRFKFSGYDKVSYPEFMRLKRPASVDASTAWAYRISFEARFIPDAGHENENEAMFGLGLCDLRGWERTHSAIAVGGAERAREWTQFKGNFQTRRECPGSSLVLRIEGVAKPIFGTLEVRNLKVELWTPASCPAYEGLTAISSLSSDGGTLHLIVFSKSYDKDIETAIDLKGFAAKSAESWTVRQDDVASVVYAAPVKAAVSLPSDGALKMRFPSHSMTAIDFKR